MGIVLCYVPCYIMIELSKLLCHHSAAEWSVNMKKITTIILSTALALLLTGFSIYTGTKLFSKEPEIDKNTSQQSDSKENKIAGNTSLPFDIDDTLPLETVNVSKNRNSKSKTNDYSVSAVSKPQKPVFLKVMMSRK